MQRKFVAGVWAFLIALIAGSPVVLQAQSADLILHNGKILTVDQNFSTAEAVAVTGNKIAAVGSEAEVMKLAGPNTQVIDLKGKTVTPGLIDTHRHMYSAAEQTYGGLLTPEKLHRYVVDWRGVSNKDDVLNVVKLIMEKYKFKPGEWIYMANALPFLGENQATVEQAKILYDDLNQWELDKVTPKNPVMMSLGIPDFNGLLLNKVAMDLIWPKYGDFIKKNGRFWIDASGRPDGHMEPPANRIALAYSYDRDPADLAVMYKKNMDENTSMGLTMIDTRLPKDTVAAYKLMQSRGELTFRVGVGEIEPFGNVTDLKDIKSYAKQIGTGDDMIWVTGVGPTAVDGVTSRACTDQKRTGTYTVIDSWFPMGQCHMDSEYKGSPKRSAAPTDNYFKNWVMASGRDGVMFKNVHVAGDRATGTLLNAVEQIQKQYGKNATKGWAFDHCDMVNPADFKRLAATQITVSCYVLHSINGSPLIAKAYGDKVANTMPSPLKSMLDAGAKVVMESDSNSYIWQDLEAAVTRKDRNGKVWAPQERVDRPTALKMMTSWAAEYVLKPDKLGSIEKGKLADLLVLDKDYLTVPEDSIHTIQPQIVVFDGRIRYVHSDYAKENNLRPNGALISTYADLIKQRKMREGGTAMGGG
jgi:predicted amidohydrolase YtcJ